MEITTSIIIKRPIAEVFDFVSHFENDTQWWLGVTESRIISDTKQGLGTRYFQLSYFLGKRNATTFEITEFNPVNYLVIRSLESAIPFVARYTLEPTSEGTRFSMNASVEWIGFFKFIKPLTHFMMQRVANKFFKKLKEVMESPSKTAWLP